MYTLRKVNTFYVCPQTICTRLVIILPRRTFCPGKYLDPLYILVCYTFLWFSYNCYGNHFIPIFSFSGIHFALKQIFLTEYLYFGPRFSPDYLVFRYTFFSYILIVAYAHFVSIFISFWCTGVHLVILVNQ